jgi:hypothetical protein
VFCIRVRVCNGYAVPSLANIPLTPETARDQERRIRREIANSNERRRMQSINAGFQSLKSLLPHTDGEKLSKVRPTRARTLDTGCWVVSSRCVELMGVFVWLRKSALHQKAVE